MMFASETEHAVVATGWFLEHAWLIPLLPAVAFFLIIFFGKRLPRVTVPDFDYTAKPAAKLEVPLAERIAEIRARKAQERAVAG